MTMAISSPVFDDGEGIPIIFTCQGEDISPELAFDGVQAAARSLVLIVDDPDAPDPDAPKMTWVHWLLYNLPPETAFLAEDEDHLPAGTLEGRNDWGRTGYGGPCPPIGVHRYFFKLYALDVRLPDLHEPNKSDLEAAMEGHVLARSQLLGTYKK